MCTTPLIVQYAGTWQLQPTVGLPVVCDAHALLLCCSVLCIVSTSLQLSNGG